uniref:Nucleolar protein 16 n=1 Tax=Hyaloperonospora arabidopsidis (strain Emoy2) TaxID=559515 RepID=M4C5T2_HYAAE
MGRLGVKIKRRGKVVQHRKQKLLRKFKTKFVRDPKVQQVWDHNLTTYQNYVKLSLEANPNAHHALRDSIKDAEGSLEALDEARLFEVPDSDFLVERNTKRVANYVSEEETKYLRKLIAKYGEDYTKMARDIKVNNMQWTEQKLRRRCARLALMDANVISLPQGSVGQS